MSELIRFIATTEATEGTDTSSLAQENVPTEIDNGGQAQQETVPTETQIEVSQEPVKYEIDGAEYTLDEINEWRKGHLRQSDYTKKTTELANQRKEYQDAIELYEYLTSKPELIAQLNEFDKANPSNTQQLNGINIPNGVGQQLDPISKKIADLESQIMRKEIEYELKEITSRDSKVTDVELVQIANEMKCPINVAYDIWKGRNFDNAIKQKELEYKKQLADEIKNDAGVTKTLISGTDATNTTGNTNLSESEKIFADKLKMSYEDYAKYKKNQW